MCGTRRLVGATAGGHRAHAKGGIGDAGRGEPGGPGAFLIRGAEGLPPAAQVRKAGSILLPAGLGAAFLFSLGPAVSWIVFATGWLLFPTVGLLARGLSGVARSGAWAEVLGRPPVLDGGFASVAPDAGTAVARIGAAAERVPATTAREEARRVQAAAERVAAALPALDPATRRWVVERYLAPAAEVLDRYANLATGRAAAAATLADVEERGLPQLTAKLDALHGLLRQEDALPVVDATAGTGGPPVTPA